MFLRSVRVENFRGIARIDVDLDRTTVLIGENNTGKTTFLEAIRLCLGRGLSRKAAMFDDYDYHLPSKDAQPGIAGALRITLDFAEVSSGEWPDELAQALAEIIVLDEDDRRHIVLQVTSSYDAAVGDFVVDWDFLNSSGKTLGGRTKRPQALYSLQQFSPFFYLSALRDATKEFNPRAALWAPFLRNPAVPQAVRESLERELAGLNKKIMEADDRLQHVKRNLEKAQDVVPLGGQDVVSLDALPVRIWEMLTRTQVNVAGPTGAHLPLSRHGAGTQSLSVLFLFEAFLEAMLESTYEKLSEPVLAIEEPEAHLHPSAIRVLYAKLEGMRGQKIIATHSGDLLASVPLAAVRRFARVNGTVVVRRVQPETLNQIDLRKLTYHIRDSRGELLFARCWLLVEGATEFWVFSAIADMVGVDLNATGIRIVAYRQIGLTTLIKVADDLGISWHCVADNDREGARTDTAVRKALGVRCLEDQLSVLPTPNMEEFLCASGCGSVYLDHISPQKRHLLTANPGDPAYWAEVVRCGDDTSKEDLARAAMECLKAQGTEVPAILRKVIERCKPPMERGNGG